MRLIQLAAGVLFATNACADWVVDPSNGCKVRDPAPPAGVTATWSGTCREGMIAGPGRLQFSDGRFLEGEFRDGDAYNAHGQMIMVNNGGTHRIVSVSYTEGRRFVSTLMPERTGFKSAAPGRLLGKWDWKSRDGKCVETHEYKSTLEVIVKSNEEVLEKLFQLHSIDAYPGVFELVATGVASNQGKDCQGHVSTLGRNNVAYIRFVDNDSFIQCNDEQQKQCYGNAKRIE